MHQVSSNALLTSMQVAKRGIDEIALPWVFHCHVIYKHFSSQMTSRLNWFRRCVPILQLPCYARWIRPNQCSSWRLFLPDRWEARSKLMTPVPLIVIRSRGFIFSCSRQKTKTSPVCYIQHLFSMSVSRSSYDCRYRDTHDITPHLQEFNESIHRLLRAGEVVELSCQLG